MADPSGQTSMPAAAAAAPVETAAARAPSQRSGSEVGSDDGLRQPLLDQHRRGAGQGSRGARSEDSFGLPGLPAAVQPDPPPPGLGSGVVVSDPPPYGVVGSATGELPPASREVLQRLQAAGLSSGQMGSPLSVGSVGGPVSSLQGWQIPMAVPSQGHGAALSPVLTTSGLQGDPFVGSPSPLQWGVSSPVEPALRTAPGGQHVSRSGSASGPGSVASDAGRQTLEQQEQRILALQQQLNQLQLQLQTQREHSGATTVSSGLPASGVAHPRMGVEQPLAGGVMMPANGVMVPAPMHQPYGVPVAGSYAPQHHLVQHHYAQPYALPYAQPYAQPYGLPVGQPSGLDGVRHPAMSYVVQEPVPVQGLSGSQSAATAGVVPAQVEPDGGGTSASRPGQHVSPAAAATAAYWGRVDRQQVSLTARVHAEMQKAIKGLVSFKQEHRAPLQVLDLFEQSVRQQELVHPGFELGGGDPLRQDSQLAEFLRGVPGFDALSIPSEDCNSYQRIKARVAELYRPQDALFQTYLHDFLRSVKEQPFAYFRRCQRVLDMCYMPLTWDLVAEVLRGAMVDAKATDVVTASLRQAGDACPGDLITVARALDRWESANPTDKLQRELQDEKLRECGKEYRDVMTLSRVQGRDWSRGRGDKPPSRDLGSPGAEGSGGRPAGFKSRGEGGHGRSGLRPSRGVGGRESKAPVSAPAKPAKFSRYQPGVHGVVPAEESPAVRAVDTQSAGSEGSQSCEEADSASDCSVELGIAHRAIIPYGYGIDEDSEDSEDSDPFVELRAVSAGQATAGSAAAVHLVLDSLLEEVWNRIESKSHTLQCEDHSLGCLAAEEEGDSAVVLAAVTSDDGGLAAAAAAAQREPARRSSRLATRAPAKPEVVDADDVRNYRQQDLQVVAQVQQPATPEQRSAVPGVARPGAQSQAHLSRGNRFQLLEQEAAATDTPAVHSRAAPPVSLPVAVTPSANAVRKRALATTMRHSGIPAGANLGNQQVTMTIRQLKDLLARGVEDPDVCAGLEGLLAAAVRSGAIKTGARSITLKDVKVDSVSDMLGSVVQWPEFHMNTLGKDVKLAVDTGACASFIPLSTFKRLKSVLLQDPTTTFKEISVPVYSINGTPLSMVGYLHNVRISHQKDHLRINLIVIADDAFSRRGSVDMLLGMDACLMHGINVCTYKLGSAASLKGTAGYIEVDMRRLDKDGLLIGKPRHMRVPFTVRQTVVMQDGSLKRVKSKTPQDKAPASKRDGVSAGPKDATFRRSRGQRSVRK